MNHTGLISIRDLSKRRERGCIYLLVHFVSSLTNGGLRTPEDGKMLAMSLAGIFAGIVQYNNDSRGTNVSHLSLSLSLSLSLVI